jgi:hypothetical protein
MSSIFHPSISTILASFVILGTYWILEYPSSPFLQHAQYAPIAAITPPTEYHTVGEIETSSSAAGSTTAGSSTASSAASSSPRILT